jgi:hypothetical protein
MAISGSLLKVPVESGAHCEERGEMPGTVDNYPLFKLRMAQSVIYTFVSAFIKADKSCLGGKR